MKPWREIATPHEDVLEGTMLQAEFAADLQAVRDGKAPPTYQDAEAFFERTVITAGMRALLTSVVRRLGGRGGDPVVQLKTGFGGGKTHTLLAVYHLATRTVALTKLQGLGPIVDDAGAGDVPTAKVAVLDGNALSPGQPWKRGKIQVHTLWGELAMQLGGAEAFALVAEADGNGTSPGKDVLRTLLELAGPCVILVDELLAYVRQFESGAKWSGGTYDSNLSFLQALTEAVKTAPQAMLLASLPESELEAGSERAMEVLSALEKLFGRVQAVWKPVDTEEAFAIVRRRLFRPIADEAARAEVCRTFAAMYRTEAARLPAETQEARYMSRMEAAYPIHPEVFDRLFQDWSTLEGFQRTRGVLKLMARVIHRLWLDNHSDAFVLPSSLPLFDRDAAGELTGYLKSGGWEAVFERDIDGSRAASTILDLANARFGPLQAARRVARTIFLGSAPSSVVQRAGVRGIDRGHILLGCLQPGQASTVYLDAVTELEGRLHYLNTNGERGSEGARYWFDTRANLRREMEERRGHFRDTREVRVYLEKVLQNQLTPSAPAFDGVHVFAGHGDVPDDDKLRLVVLAPSARFEKPIDAAQELGGGGRLTEAPEATDGASVAAQEYLKLHGTKPRIAVNRLLFLAADKHAYERLHTAVVTSLVWESIEKDIEDERLNVDKHNARSAKTQLDQARKVVEQLVRECFKWLLCPQQLDARGAIRMEVLPLKTSGNTLRDEIARICREHEWVVTTWAACHLRDVLKAYYWTGNRQSAGAMHVYRDSEKFVYLPRLRREDVFTAAVKQGSSSRDFFAVAHGKDDERWLGLSLGEPLLQVDAMTLLVQPDVAISELLRAEKGAATSVPDPAGAAASTGSHEGGARLASTTLQAPLKTAVSAAKAPKPTHFFASKALPAESAKHSFSELNAALLKPLTEAAGDVGAKVTVTVEIAADAPEGFPSELRAVLEKALKDYEVEHGGFS